MSNETPPKKARHQSSTDMENQDPVDVKPSLSVTDPRRTPRLTRLASRALVNQVVVNAPAADEQDDDERRVDVKPSKSDIVAQIAENMADMPDFLDTTTGEVVSELID